MLALLIIGFACFASGAVFALVAHILYSDWQRRRFSRAVWRAIGSPGIDLSDDPRIRGDEATLRAHRRKPLRSVKP